MQKLPFQFAIVNEATEYYYVADGVVYTSTTPKYYNEIIDWASISLNYKRHAVFHGMIKSYSPEMLKFTKEGAQILRYINNTQGGGEAVAFLQVSVLDESKFFYNLLDYWQFNFSVVSNQLLYFGVSLMDGGLTNLVTTGQSTNHNVPLNDPALAPATNFPLYNPLPANELSLDPPARPYLGTADKPVYPPVPQLIYLDGIPILNQMQYVTNPDGFVMEVAQNPPFAISMGLFPSQTIGDYPNGTTETQGSDGSIGLGDPNFIFRVGLQAGKMYAGFNLKYTYENVFHGTSYNADAKMVVYLYVYTGTGGGWGTHVDTIFLCESPVVEPGNSIVMHQVGQSVSFEVQPDYILSVGFVPDSFGSPLDANECKVTFDPTDILQPLPAITLNMAFVPPSTVTRGISHADFFKYLSACVATNGGLLDNVYASRSTLLESSTKDIDLIPNQTFITCGDSLRGLKTITITDPYYPPFPGPTGEPFDTYVVPAIYTNLQDFQKDVFADLEGSIGVEKNGIGQDVLVCEKLDYFYNDDLVIFDLGTDIANFEMIPYNEYKASSVIIGQPDQQFDAVNGPLETMSNVTYNTPVTRINKVIDMTTAYRRDPYGIELTRANIGNKTNVNSSSDNDTFKLYVKSLTPETVTTLDSWVGMSGYEATDWQALKLARATDDGANGIISGLPAALLSPTSDPHGMFNMVFSPQRAALRLRNWFASNYRGLLTTLMGISSKKKNIKVISDLGTGQIDESHYINIGVDSETYTAPFTTTPVTLEAVPIPDGKTTAAYFKPHVFSFTSPVPVELPLAMTPPIVSDGSGGWIPNPIAGAGKMYGKILFTFVRDGISYPLGGFVLEAGITPGTNATYNYKLLCSPTIDIPDYL